MSKKVVITGVSSGFGLAAASTLLARGYHVFGSVRKKEDATRVSELLKSQSFTPLLFDVTTPDAIYSSVAHVTNMLNGEGITGLVNNAGIAPIGPLEHTSLKQLRQVFEVNVFGVLAVTQSFLPLLKLGENGTAGRIVNISSSSGGITFPMLGAYSASKYALESLNDGLRRELFRYDIPVIAIEPGSIRTPIWEKTARQDTGAEFSDTTYAKLMAQMPAFFEQQLQGAKPITVVTNAIISALEARKPRTRYPLDSLWYAGKYIGDRALDKIIRWRMPKG